MTVLVSEQQFDSAVWLDWGAAASPAVAHSPRIQPLAFRYCGSADPHWASQPCDLIEPNDAPPGLNAVVFGCGCVGQVPRSSLTQL